MACPTNTTVATDNTPLECNEYTKDTCVIHEDAITFLSLSAGSTQAQINNALVLTLMNALNRITQLENQLNE